MKNQLLGKVLAFAGATGLLMVAAKRAEAALIVLRQTSQASTGSTGTFDVVLQNTGGASVSMGRFSFGILTLNPGITFAVASISTVPT